MTVLTSQALAEGVVLAMILAAITVVDFRQMIIPNSLNLLLAASGLGFCAISGPIGVATQGAFAAAVFVIFLGIRHGHRQTTGRMGLGLGDVKMMAAAACWLDPLLFPLLLFVASASALLAFGGQAMVSGGVTAETRIPFGPFIAIGLGCSWAFQQFFAWI